MSQRNSLSLSLPRRVLQIGISFPLGYCHKLWAESMVWNENGSESVPFDSIQKVPCRKQQLCWFRCCSPTLHQGSPCFIRRRIHTICLSAINAITCWTFARGIRTTSRLCSAQVREALERQVLEHPQSRCYFFPRLSIKRSKFTICSSCSRKCGTVRRLVRFASSRLAYGKMNQTPVFERS